MTDEEMTTIDRLATGHNFKVNELWPLVTCGILQRKTIPALTMGDDERDFSYRVDAPMLVQIEGKWFGHNEIFFDRS